MPAERTLYEILQVDSRVEPEILEAAYRRLARKYHPDVAAADPTGLRMREINAAFEVLRDPHRRAAYDRELLAQKDHAGRRDRWEPAPDPAVYERRPAAPAQTMLACRQHHGAVAVGTCLECGAGLCGRCFERFQPPSCASCMLAWTGRRRRELVLSAVWFFALTGLAALLLVGAAVGIVHSRPVIVAIETLLGYVVASYPSGWRVMRGSDGDDYQQDGPVALLLAAVVGPVVAPFRMGKILWDLRQVRQLEAIARGRE
ncbi:MAG TPA: DnaJ domain-containing protein [Candidatus Dormibacteraeota bacterium]